MRVLFISTDFPFPPDLSGGTLNVFYLIKGLKHVYSKIYIGFLHFGDSSKISEDDKNQFSKFVDEIRYVPFKNNFLNRLQFLLFKRKLCINYDLIFICEYTSAVMAQKLTLRGPKILYAADSRRFYFNQINSLRAKMRLFQVIIEQKYYERICDKLLYVNKRDSMYDAKYSTNPQKYLAAPISSIEHSFIKSDNYEFDILFSGNMGYLPNRLGAEYLVNEIMPGLLAKFPKLKICIAGRIMKDRPFRFAFDLPPSVQITGQVPNLFEYYQKALLYVAPIFLGSGMKNKILHAMMARLPIITTVEGASGFDNGEQFIICEHKNDWVNNIESLIQNPKLCKEMTEHNYSIFREHYETERVIAKHFLPLFNVKKVSG